MNRKITKKEAVEYLDTIANGIYKKEDDDGKLIPVEGIKDLNSKQKKTIDLNLLVREKDGEIDRRNFKVLRKQLKEMN